MSTIRTKKAFVLTFAVLSTVALATLAAPFSVSISFDAGASVTANIAHAEAPCGLGETRTELSDGKIQCAGPYATIIYNPDGSSVTTNNSDGATWAKDKDGSTTLVRTASCSSVLMFMSSPFTCGFRAIVTLTAGTLIYISTWILAAAASLFNWLVDNTIIQFGAFYQATIKAAVETAWTAFRDIANIFIIGIFTYIAISIILGLKEFGQKKMIASVLIVAVLINFSLLFTKMVIDASNFAAAQVYTAAALGSSTDTQGTPVGSAPTGTKYGIAEQFMYLLGVGGFADSLGVVSATAEAKDSGWVALLHGLLVMAVVLGAALVLFYGSFLLISRMIMLIFLLVTAAIAVASYLIPDWGTSSYGFKAWKSSLIWCATFAPMLMIFLWMTLNVSYALKGTSKATLGAALSNPAGGENIVALFNYVFVLGLLFTTFKLSSMWSDKIGGFSYVKMATALPFTLGSRAAGLALRYAPGFGGRGSARRALDLDDKIETARNQARVATGADRLQKLGELERLMRQKGRATTRAESSFNLMNTSAAKAVMAEVGVKGFAAGADKKPGSFAETSTARAERAAKAAAELALSADDKKKIGDTAVEKETERRRKRREDIERDEKHHKDTMRTMESALKSETAPLEVEKGREASKKGDLEKKHNAILEKIAEEMAGSTDEKTREGHKGRYIAAQAAQKSELDEQDNKIRTIDDKLKTITAPVTALQGKIESLNNELKDLNKPPLEKFRTNAIKAAEDLNREVAMPMGARLAYGSTLSTMQKALGIDPEKTVAGIKAFKQTKKKFRIKSTLDLDTARREALESAGESTGGEESPAPAPSEGETHT